MDWYKQQQSEYEIGNVANKYVGGTNYGSMKDSLLGSAGMRLIICTQVKIPQALSGLRMLLTLHGSEWNTWAQFVVCFACSYTVAHPVLTG